MLATRSFKFKERLVYTLIIFTILCTFYLYFDLNLSTSGCIKYFKSSKKFPEYKERKPFNKLFAYLNAGRNYHEPRPFEMVILQEEYDSYNPTIAQILGKTLLENATYLERFQLAISRQSIYKENDEIVQKLLNKMVELPIIHLDTLTAASHMRYIAYYENEIYAVLKPVRLPRDRQTVPNHYYFQDFERPNAEIAAYHLDKILGFRRTMPVVGRKMDVRTDFYMPVDPITKITFFRSPRKNVCFYGNCTNYCEIFYPVCGHPFEIEGAFISFLPEITDNNFSIQRLEHPWARPTEIGIKPKWIDDYDYCAKVQKDPLYKGGRRLLDLMDMAVFDFLIGNLNRNEYHQFSIFGNNSSPIHYDHGRAFGNAFVDDLTILAPIKQCCIIRESTLSTLLNFQTGSESLSQKMRKSMSIDPIAPILWSPHLEALDRRVEIILEAIQFCIDNTHILHK